MSKKNVNFDDKNKKVVKINDIDVNKILVSKEESYSAIYIKIYNWIQW